MLTPQGTYAPMLQAQWENDASVSVRPYVFGVCRIAVSGLCFVQKMLGALIVRGWMDSRMQRGRRGLEPEGTVQNAMVLRQICTG